jgi:hypothetical protein
MPVFCSFKERRSRFITRLIPLLRDFERAKCQKRVYGQFIARFIPLLRAYDVLQQ